jgi:hypothetical protein
MVPGRRQKTKKGSALTCKVDKAIAEQLSHRSPEEIHSVCEILVQKFVRDSSSSSNNKVWCTEENIKGIKTMIENLELRTKVKMSSSELKCDLARYLYLANEASLILDSLPTTKGDASASSQAAIGGGGVDDGESGSDEEDISLSLSSSASFLFQETSGNGITTTTTSTISSITSGSGDCSEQVEIETSFSPVLSSDFLSDLISTDSSSFEE